MILRYTNRTAVAVMCKEFDTHTVNARLDPQPLQIVPPPVQSVCWTVEGATGIPVTEAVRLQGM
jgi:hypothetical protein